MVKYRTDVKEGYKTEGYKTGMEYKHKWLTTTDLAERLHVHPRTIRRWVKEQGLPAGRVGQHGWLRFIESAVIQWAKIKNIL